jgi:cysteinyl-tRNA synthetase
MPIYLYNSLTRRKEEFVPLNPPQVNIYACGVTVYDHCHIGHARSLYIFEVVRRYLQYRGFKTRFVRNITDIDDKIIDKASQQNTTTFEVARHYTRSYYEDLAALGIERADVEPKATENIAQMIEDISVLINKGYAYEAGGDVYFRVGRFKNYGRLSGQSLEQMFSGVRIEPPGNKQGPLDFALWKKSKPGEPYWQSPWGLGRPGWHIECSAMSMEYLYTQTLDIHAGGRDLIFPHHENEIAQAEAKTGKQFARYWLHHGLLSVKGQKMAKSLGNFVTIKYFLQRYPADILKLFFLQAHYRSPVDFSWEKMDEIKKAYERFIILLNRLQERFGTKDLDAVIAESNDDEGESILKFRQRFCRAMDDDFNTPVAVAVLFELLNYLNRVMDNYRDEDRFVLKQAWSLFKEATQGVFSLTFHSPAGRTTLADDDVEVIVRLRQGLRDRGDFARADQIRKELEQKGIILEDTREGTRWRRKI